MIAQVRRLDARVSAGPGVAPAEAAGALVLVLLLAGNVAARELPADGDGCLSVGPCLDRSIEDLHLRLKLTTNAGYDALVRD